MAKAKAPAKTAETANVNILEALTGTNVVQQIKDAKEQRSQVASMVDLLKNATANVRFEGDAIQGMDNTELLDIFGTLRAREEEAKEQALNVKAANALVGDLFVVAGYGTSETGDTTALMNGIKLEFVRRQLVEASGEDDLTFATALINKITSSAS